MTDRQDLIDALETLFDETGKAHHQAFVATDGKDPAWAEWYAHYAHDRVEALLDVEIPESELARLFEDIEKLSKREGPASEWPRYCAEFFVDRFAGE